MRSTPSLIDARFIESKSALLTSRAQSMTRGVLPLGLGARSAGMALKPLQASLLI